MEKAQAIRIIVQCAATYHTELVNKNVLFIYKSNDQLSTLETCFLPRHFLHLTGVRFAGSSSDFLRLCLAHKISPQQIQFANNGTTEMKLQVLPELVSIHKSARMLGPYNHSKALLYTEKLVGSVRGCLGFVEDGKYYMPNSAIREDIRNLTSGCKHIVAVFTKDVKEANYSACSYKNSGVIVSDIMQVKEHSHFFDTLV